MRKILPRHFFVSTIFTSPKIRSRTRRNASNIPLPPEQSRPAVDAQRAGADEGPEGGGDGRAEEEERGAGRELVVRVPAGQHVEAARDEPALRQAQEQARRVPAAGVAHPHLQHLERAPDDDLQGDPVVRAHAVQDDLWMCVRYG